MYNKVLVVHLALKTPLDGRWQAFDPCETQPTSFLSVSYIHTSGGRDQPSWMEVIQEYAFEDRKLVQLASFSYGVYQKLWGLD